MGDCLTGKDGCDYVLKAQTFEVDLEILARMIPVMDITVKRKTVLAEVQSGNLVSMVRVGTLAHNCHDKRSAGSYSVTQKVRP